MNWVHSIYDVVLDRSPEELLGAIGVAVALSMLFAGVFALLRRKVEDRVLLVIALMIVASVASMGLGAGYVTAGKKHGPRLPFGTEEGSWVRYSAPLNLSPRLMARCDADGDGRLSPTEASQAAAHFITALDDGREGSVDIARVIQAILKQGNSPHQLAAEETGLGPGSHTTIADWMGMRADRDRDGRLTTDESALFLKSADLDGDGIIDPRELRRLFRPIAEPTEPDGGRFGHPPGQPFAEGVVSGGPGSPPEPMTPMIDRPTSPGRPAP